MQKNEGWEAINPLQFLDVWSLLTVSSLAVESCKETCLQCWEVKNPALRPSLDAKFSAETKLNVALWLLPFPSNAGIDP